MTGPRGESSVVAGNVYDKYATGNPIARRLMARFLTSAEDLVRQTGARSAHEVGCGEGHLATILAQQGLAIRGSDLSTQIIAEAGREAERRGVELPLKVASLYDLRAPADAEQLIVCCEVLEHLEEPERAISVLAQLARPWLLASVPREPLWRLLNVARGKYLRELGNTPGHLQHFSSRDFLDLLSSRFEIIEVRRPLPWTMALARLRS